jgi:hypothetical protein
MGPQDLPLSRRFCCDLLTVLHNVVRHPRILSLSDFDLPDTSTDMATTVDVFDKRRELCSIRGTFLDIVCSPVVGTGDGSFFEFYDMATLLPLCPLQDNSSNCSLALSHTSLYVINESIQRITLLEGSHVVSLQVNPCPPERFHSHMEF